MVRKAKGKWHGWAVFLCLLLVCRVVPAGAQQLGDWTGYFSNLSGPDYFEHAMDVPQDGSVTLMTAVDSTFLNQFSSIQVRDQNGDLIDYTILLESPNTWAIRLAAGSFIVRIARGQQNRYGNYHITANLAPANPGATEVEINDTIAAANTNPNNLFAGAIGYIRAKDTLDWYDYYRFTLTQDTNVHFDLTTADTLVSFNTVLSLVNGSDTSLNYTYLSAPSQTWDLFLAAGTYYLRLYIADWSRYGGYTIATTTTPAVANSSETENNDALAAANPIRNKTLYGSIGYMRDTGFFDNSDYFSCQVAQGGTLNVEILPSDSLRSFNNALNIRNGSGVRLDYAYLASESQSASVNNLDAGTYYIQVYRAAGYGAYQIKVSGNVIVPGPGSVGSIMLPLLLSD